MRLAWVVAVTLLAVVALAQVRRDPAPGPPVVAVGEASYALRPPPDAKGPPPPVRLGAGLTGPVPTNRDWSSLITGDRPLPHYPHPLAVHPCARGLRVHDPGPSLSVDAHGVHGALPERGGEDLTLGHAAARELAEITLEEFGDWTVRVRLASAANRLDVRYGHGSPYVHATLEGGGARLTFAAAPTVWAGGAGEATLGVTVRGRHYGLFGPAGSTWSGLGGLSWTNAPQGARHFSLALLPAATPEVLELFRRHAHAHVTGSQASLRYDRTTSAVTTTFSVETAALEGEERETIFALYPHQWAHTSAALLPGLEYPSVRGPMRLALGTGFTTTLTYPGILPALPAVAAEDADRRAALLEDELARAKSPPLDSYWEAKLLGRLATLVPLAEEAGPEQARRLVAALARRLERRFTALDAAGAVKADDRFDYDRAWGTLIARPASFGSETSLNDHHLHYGYYLRAAAEVARLDPDWAKDERFGGMVRLLVRDIASPDRADPLFPYLRCFDVYAGHSWAAGLVDSPSGANLESSSESMNAWSAIILLGSALGDAALRDLGICLYTTELAAIEEYWFDVERRTFPPALDLPALAMIWGGKGVLETWFSTEPEALFGINWLPLHGGSLYLGRHPAKAAQVYEALRGRRGSDAWRLWPDLVIMYRALSDPEDAARQLAALDPTTLTEAGNSRLNLERWVGALRALGHVDRTTTADCPLHAVFERDGKKVHVAYRMPRDPPFVATFSDGATVRCDEPGFSLGP